MRFTVAAVSAIILGSLAVNAAPTVEKRATSGQATWYRQGGNAGSCGKTHSDDDKVVAVAEELAGKHCGEKITVKHGDKTMTATVADTCPECDYGHLDLSRGAFESLASFDQGEVPITWWFN
ncbi:hypothetical protein L7F22_019124 [Adiantum nelumboides]|nr:hypothetical protein [Adiantum nelumboides]